MFRLKFLGQWLSVAISQNTKLYQLQLALVSCQHFGLRHCEVFTAALKTNDYFMALRVWNLELSSDMAHGWWPWRLWSVDHLKNSAVVLHGFEPKPRSAQV